jgi:AAA family ATP:ADP antiporter
MLSPDEPGTPERRNALERLLSVFTQVKAGEGLSAVLLTLNVFLLLTAYYVIRPLREAMMAVMEGGAQYASYLSAVVAVALIGAVPAYARFARKLPRNRLVVGVTLFFVSNLVLFALAMASDTLRDARIPLGPLGAILPTESVGLMPVVFFVWVSIFNMMVVAQFWAFSNDLYTEEQGKRLFPMLGIGASMGAVLGTGVVRVMAQEMTAAQLFALSAGILTLCAVLTQVVHVREVRRRPVDDGAGAATSADPPSTTREADGDAKKAEGAFQMVWRHRYLTLLAAFSVVFTLENTNGQYMLVKSVGQWVQEEVEAHSPFESEDAQEEFVDEQSRAFFGGFFFWQNLFSALLQMFVLSRLVKYAGVGPTFFVLPVIALMGMSAIALFPVLAVVRVAKIGENATDYSINNTMRNMLWLPTTTEMKYQAKQAVDTFFVRMGDLGSAITVAVMAGMLGLGIRAFAIFNVVILVAWVFLARGILKERRILLETPGRGDPTEAVTAS